MTDGGPATSEPQTVEDSLRAELHLMKTAGIIEVAVRNPSVAEYMDHWEARALKAEAAAPWHRIDDPVNPPPRDGTHIILAFYGTGQAGGYEIAAWGRSIFDHSDNGRWRAAGGGKISMPPSHWMPLPQPPVTP